MDGKKPHGKIKLQPYLKFYPQFDTDKLFGINKKLHPQRNLRNDWNSPRATSSVPIKRGLPTQFVCAKKTLADGKAGFWNLPIERPERKKKNY